MKTPKVVPGRLVSLDVTKLLGLAHEIVDLVYLQTNDREQTKIQLSGLNPQALAGMLFEEYTRVNRLESKIKELEKVIYQPFSK